MEWTADRTKLSHAAGKSIRFDHTRLRALIDEATFNSKDESDEHAGLLSMIRQEVACPFWARVEGEEVECVRFEWPITPAWKWLKVLSRRRPRDRGRNADLRALLSCRGNKRGYGLNAICRGQKGKSRTVDIGSLQWTDPLPKGYEWIEAYLAWRKEVGF